RYWADAKRDVRKHCDYTYKGLQERLPIALDNASPPGNIPVKIRKYYSRCIRYIEAYKVGMDAWAADEEVTEFTTRKSTSHRGVSDAWFKKLRIINLVHRTLADFINDNKENFTIWTVPTKVASQTVMNECDKQESLEKCRYQKDLWSPHFDKANILRKNRHAYQMEGLKLLGEASSGCSKIMSRALEAPSNQQDDDEGDDVSKR
ncbi:hypothetical protein DFQ28_000188, partial [Apophysomyces sp. BC1034]